MFRYNVKATCPSGGMADAAVSKTVVERRASSTLASGTIQNQRPRTTRGRFRFCNHSRLPPFHSTLTCGFHQKQHGEGPQCPDHIAFGIVPHLAETPPRTQQPSRQSAAKPASFRQKQTRRTACAIHREPFPCRYSCHSRSAPPTSTRRTVVPRPSSLSTSKRVPGPK